MAKKQHSSAGIVLSHEALIHARRVKHDMSQEQLANAAKIDVKTIRRAEDEKPIDPSFGHIIANALGVELSSLVKRDPTSPNPIADAVAKLLMVIVFSGDYPPPYKAQAVKLLNELILFLGLQHGFHENDVKAQGGSLIVTVPLSRRDAATLVNAFITGVLTQFDIVSVRIESEAQFEQPSPQGTQPIEQSSVADEDRVERLITRRGFGEVHVPADTPIFFHYSPNSSEIGIKLLADLFVMDLSDEQLLNLLRLLSPDAGDGLAATIRETLHKRGLDEKRTNG